jgi:hypothetical protein
MHKEGFLRKLTDARRNIETLGHSIKSMESREVNIQQHPMELQSKIAEIQRLHRTIDQQYVDAQQSIRDLLQLAETVLTQSPAISTPTGRPAMPSRDEVQGMMNAFFKGGIKKRSAPIPTYCGCYAWRNPVAHYGHFVCANLRNSYILMIVVQFENDICSVFDPTDVDDGIKIMELKKDEWAPLPTVIPEKPLKRWEHAKDSTVLSLWPNREEWTTEFYKATVRLQPCERPDHEERGYLLDFESAVSPVIVPEKFVVAFPDSWKNQET